MKVSELEGALLDSWVARAMGYTYGCTSWRKPENVILCYPFSPSRIWAHGGPIIEQEKLSVTTNMGGSWIGTANNASSKPGLAVVGPTPLIAAMRAYVASKYGEEVPNEGCD